MKLQMHEYRTTNMFLIVLRATFVSKTVKFRDSTNSGCDGVQPLRFDIIDFLMGKVANLCE